MNKKFKQKMRKAADGGNLALIALAIGVIIIIGMYLFTNAVGSNLNDTGTAIDNGLNAANNGALTPSSSNP